MRIIRPDHEDQSLPHNAMTVFLAGTIDNGAVEPWAHIVAEAFEGRNIVFYDPRRENWLPDIEKRARNPVFREQVEWELSNISTANIVFFNFVADSLSPITLQELGYVVAKDSRVIVVCPDGFWRKGNVEIMCGLHAIPVYSSIEDGIEALKAWASSYKLFDEKD